MKCPSIHTHGVVHVVNQILKQLDLILKMQLVGQIQQICRFFLTYWVSEVKFLRSPGFVGRGLVNFR